MVIVVNDVPIRLDALAFLELRHEFFGCDVLSVGRVFPVVLLHEQRQRPAPQKVLIVERRRQESLMDELFPIVRVEFVQPQPLSLLIGRVHVSTWLDLVGFLFLVAILPNTLGHVERSPVHIANELIRRIGERSGVDKYRIDFAM